MAGHLQFIALWPVSHAGDEKLGGVWVKAEGSFHLGNETTIELAQRGSLEAARRAAIEKAVGVNVTGATLVRNAHLVEDLVQVISRGMIIEEQIIERGLKIEDKNSNGAYRTLINAFVVRLPMSQHDSDFSIISRLDRTVYQHGDRAELRVTPNQDAYLYVFSVTEDEHITVLVPNRYLQEARVVAGKEFVFPTPDLTKRGIKLTTLIPPGKKRSAEHIKVIATRRPMDILKHRAPEAIFEEYRPSDTVLLVDLLKTLTAVDPSHWTESSSRYEIVKP
jgi:hypothetical protein